MPGSNLRKRCKKFGKPSSSSGYAHGDKPREELPAVLSAYSPFHCVRRILLTFEQLLWPCLLLCLGPRHFHFPTPNSLRCQNSHAQVPHTARTRRRTSHPTEQASFLANNTLASHDANGGFSLSWMGACKRKECLEQIDMK